VLFSHVLAEFELTILFYSVRITGVAFDKPSETSANDLSLDINFAFETGFKPSKDLIVLVDGDRKVAVLEDKKNRTQWTTNPNM
jgi:hypothetical protein